ncbi:MAG TPA: hypothetical protein VF160_01180 [Candidatus Dormibacteraeota bacterium]
MIEFTVRDRLRWLGVTLVVAAAAVPLSFVLWRTPPGVAVPPPGMLPILLPVEVVIPALSLGLGVAFMLFGRKLVIRERASALSRASFVSIWWLLVNWWPHSNFHRVSTGWVSLTAIDYFFHTTVIVATCVVAAFFLSVIRERQQVPLLDGVAFDVGPAQAVGGRS